MDSTLTATRSRNESTKIQAFLHKLQAPCIDSTGTASACPTLVSGQPATARIHSPHDKANASHHRALTRAWSAVAPCPHQACPAARRHGAIPAAGSSARAASTARSAPRTAGSSSSASAGSSSMRHGPASPRPATARASASYMEPSPLSSLSSASTGATGCPASTQPPGSRSTAGSPAPSPGRAAGQDVIPRSLVQRALLSITRAVVLVGANNVTAHNNKPRHEASFSSYWLAKPVIILENAHLQ